LGFYSGFAHSGLAGARAGAGFACFNAGVVPEPRAVLKRAIGTALIVAVVVFFYRAFQENWEKLQTADFHADPLCCAGTVLAFILSTLAGTYAWRATINDLSPRPLDLGHSIALVNTSSLTKYLPGKLWSYALQMHWLSDQGTSKSAVLFANLVNLLASVVTSSLVGLLGFALFPADPAHRPLLLLLFVGLALCYGVGLVFHAWPLRLMTQLLNRVFKRQMEAFEFRPAALFQLQLGHGLGALFEGAGLLLAWYGLGVPGPIADGIAVAAAGLIGNVIGFLAIVVPGGLGVRETVMWWLLNQRIPTSVSLVLPLITRLAFMLADVILGALALFLLRQYRGNLRAPTAAEASE
jgi:glycosyltransferase 2 family protein